MEELVLLRSLILELGTKLDELSSENALLRAQNADLVRRLSQHSQNSHFPPSSDKFISPPKPNPQPAFPRKRGKKQGGQHGHDGKTLLMVSDPDSEESHVPQTCSCGQDLSQFDPIFLEKRQIFDLPDPKLWVTEHRVYAKVCTCGCRVKGEFPANLTAPTQYGAGVSAFVTLLSNAYHLSYQKISQIFQDLFDTPINVSTCFSMQHRTADYLSQATEQIRQKVANSAVVNADETKLYCASGDLWNFTLSTPQYTYGFVHEKRGKLALYSEKSFLSTFENTLVHDCFKPYWGFKNCQHALCNAHILRELNGLIEQTQEVSARWARTIHQMLMRLYELSQKGTDTLADIENWAKRYDRVLNLAQKMEPPPTRTHQKQGKHKRTKGRNLLERLVAHKNEILKFAYQKDVPFTNNQAERDIRPLKSKIKIAGTFRIKSAAENFVNINNFISTIRKKKLNPFKEIKNACKNRKYQF